MKLKNILLPLAALLITWALPSCSDEDKRSAAVTIEGIVPEQAGRDEQVLINGENFPLDASRISVTVNGMDMPIVRSNEEQLLVTVPFVGVKGTWPIVVTVDGKPYESPVGFTYSGPYSFSEDAILRTVSVQAGSGIAGYRDGRGTDAQFSLMADRGYGRPGGIAVDKDGNVYVADPANQCIRKITPEGQVTTVAGCGPDVDISDWGLDWRLQNGAYDVDMRPADVAVDSDGIIYTLCPYTGASMRIEPDGRTHYLGWAPFNNIALDEARRRVYFSDPGKKIVAYKSMDDYGPDTAPPTEVMFEHPYAGIAVDPATGDLYLASPGENQIWKHSIDNWTDRTLVAGSGEGGHMDGDAPSARFESPWGLAFDSEGNLLVAGNGAVSPAGNADQSIRYIDLSNGTVSTFAGSAAAGSATGTFEVPVYAGFMAGGDADPQMPLLTGACSVAVDSECTVYVFDGGNNRILKIVTK